MPALTAARAAVSRKAFAGTRLQCACANGSATFMSSKALWLPGADSPRLNPSYLDGSLPGLWSDSSCSIFSDTGFDPLGLADTPEALERFTESELIHCRFAMLGAAGVLGVELLGRGDWVSAQAAVPMNSFIAASVLFLSFVEGARQTDSARKLYPGGAFDPLKLSADPAAFAKAKVQEVKNGRLAMLACAGFAFQAASTGASPLANLAAHVADPWHHSVAQNAVALPFLSL